LRRLLPAIAVSISILFAFGFRVLPAYQALFTAHSISFEEPDAWFHMRNIHNLLAHFPRRSGFDPYALYPRGQNTLTETANLASADGTVELRRSGGNTLVEARLRIQKRAGGGLPATRCGRNF
jgi:hypothetical protein